VGGFFIDPDQTRVCPIGKFFLGHEIRLLWEEIGMINYNDSPQKNGQKAAKIRRPAAVGTARMRRFHLKKVDIFTIF
jgi:hypothetical protein